jgi:hypothetical protein
MDQRDRMPQKHDA